MMICQKYSRFINPSSTFVDGGFFNLKQIKSLSNMRKKELTVMEYERDVLHFLSKAFGEEVTLRDVGFESYAFDVAELDPEIIPTEYKPVLARYKEVMTHMYDYKSTIVYVIVPLEKKDGEQVLIGVMEEGKFIYYVFVK